MYKLTISNYFFRDYKCVHTYHYNIYIMFNIQLNVMRPSLVAKGIIHQLNESYISSVLLSMSPDLILYFKRNAGLLVNRSRKEYEPSKKNGIGPSFFTLHFWCFMESFDFFMVYPFDHRCTHGIQYLHIVVVKPKQDYTWAYIHPRVRTFVRLHNFTKPLNSVISTGTCSWTFVESAHVHALIRSIQ